MYAASERRPSLTGSSSDDLKLAAATLLRQCYCKIAQIVLQARIDFESVGATEPELYSMFGNLGAFNLATPVQRGCFKALAKLVVRLVQLKPTRLASAARTMA
eukprot:SAG22_NODE_3508_length_1673_cov_4.916773_1_plen_103_part_00